MQPDFRFIFLVVAVTKLTSGGADGIFCGFTILVFRCNLRSRVCKPIQARRSSRADIGLLYWISELNCVERLTGIWEITAVLLPLSIFLSTTVAIRYNTHKNCATAACLSLDISTKKFQFYTWSLIHYRFSSFSQNLVMTYVRTYGQCELCVSHCTKGHNLHITIALIYLVVSNRIVAVYRNW